jgi:basic membrane lipoprotein Med (substrate-binding protein (PBP1-ABC) superfamily)
MSEEVIEQIVEPTIEPTVESTIPEITGPREFTRKEKDQIKKDLLAGGEHDFYELKKASNGTFRLQKKKVLTTTEKNVKEQTDRVIKNITKQTFMTNEQLLFQNYSELKSRMETENVLLRQKLKKYKKRLNDALEDDIEEVNVEPISESTPEPIQESTPELIQESTPDLSFKLPLYRSKFRR